MTDRLMQSLGQAAREQADDADGEDRWSALCAGELSAAEAETLRARAQASESGRRAKAAFEPLGADFRAGIVRRLHRQIETEAASAEGLGSGDLELGEAEPDETEPDDVEPAGRPVIVWWRRPAVAATLAAAAATAIALLWPRPELTPMPAYQLVLAGGASSSRAAEPEVESRFVAGSPFRLLLRPETTVDGPPVAVRAFVGHGPNLEPWEPPMEVADQGSVLIEGTLGDEIRLDPGRNVLSVAIGRHGKLPTAAVLRDIAPDDLEGRQTPDWVLMRLAVTVAEDP